MSDETRKLILLSPRITQAAPTLFEALKDLVLRCDQTELADGSSLDTVKAHAALNLVEPGEWL